MVENLRLTGAKTLHASDSNVTSDWNLPAENTSFPTSCVDTAYNMSSGNTTYGNYYNWYAATAGTGTCAMTSGSASSSICPKGWRLPTGGSGGEFQAVYGQYKSTAAMQASPVSFTLSGHRSGSSTDSQGSYGHFWSSTAYDASHVYSLYMTTSGVNAVGNYNDKYYGFTIRCVSL